MTTTVTITVSEEHLAKLQEKARRLQIEPQILLQAGLEDLLGRSDAEFERTVKYILEKNARLYRSLAAFPER